MGLVLNTNLAAINTQKAVSGTQASMSTSMQRLATGLRVNSAKDDAAGLAIGTKMDSQMRGLNVAIRNANDGISMVQVADGALSTIGNVLGRMRELAVQAKNGTFSSTERTALDKEYQSLATSITNIAGQTKFNGIAVIAGGAATFALQVGANASDTLNVTTTAATGYLATPGDITSAANASTAIGALDTAIDSVNTDRASYGAALNTLDFTVTNLQNAAENQAAARSRIMDTDFSAETANLSKSQVLQQAGIAMLAQANQQPQMILSLLK